jgi:hypothetical protein
MQKAQQEALRRNRENNIKNIQTLENIYAAFTPFSAKKCLLCSVKKK